MINSGSGKDTLKNFLDGKTFGDIKVRVNEEGLMLTDNWGSQKISFNEIDEIIFGTQYDEHRIKIEKTNGDTVELRAYPVE